MFYILIVLRRLPYSTMPKGRKKKGERLVVLPTLSDTEDAALSPAPTSAPVTAPATAPTPAPADEVPGEPLVSSSPKELEGLTQQSSSSQPPAKRQKKQLRQLTHEEQEDMAEWLQANPCLYNKKLETYRKTDMKKHLSEEKVAEFHNADVDYLLGWCKSIRTPFGKLSKIPSGSRAQEITDRDAGILSQFGFLKTQISRQRGTQLGGVSIKKTARFKKLNSISYPHVLLYYFHFV